MRLNERSLNTSWEKMDIYSMQDLIGKRLTFIHEECPREEIGYYYYTHKGLHELSLDILSISQGNLHIRAYARRIMEDDIYLDEEQMEQESEFNIMKGDFMVSFNGIGISEHGYPWKYNFTTPEEVKSIVSQVLDLQEFKGPYYSFGDKPYAKDGSCCFECNYESDVIPKNRG